MAECSHKMRMIGDLVFECEDCHHTEIGCSHSRTTERNGRLTCLICRLELNPITLDPLEKPKTVPRPQSLTTEEIAKLLGAKTICECDLITATHIFMQRNQCQHEFEAVDFDKTTDDRIVCKKCKLVKTCDHSAGEFMENPSGCCFCELCGAFTGLAH